jgi:toxin-antitoxin system PIN domain toxin
VRVVDANVLLYAINSDAHHHESSRTWLDNALSGRDTVGFSWVAMLAFLRLSTKTGLFPNPLPVAAATAQLDAWTSAPGAVVVHPGPGHVAELARLLASVGVAGNLVNDAHLAAIALEQRGDVITYDHDFALFPGVRWHRPDDLLR